LGGGAYPTAPRKLLTRASQWITGSSPLHNYSIMTTVALVGSSGNFGHKILPVLIASEAIKSVHNLSRHAGSNASSAKIKHFQVDYMDVKTLEEALRGCDVLINVMGTNLDHVQSKINLVDAAANVGVKIYFPRSVEMKH
jgi:saccharopine dehydrogenase-like NADP-dependent oxidoreductase